MQSPQFPARRLLAGAASYSVAIEEPPLPGARLRTAAGQGQRVALFGLAVVVLAGTVSALLMRGAAVARDPEPVSAPPAPAAVWVDVNRPIQLFGLSGSAFARLPLAYHARRREAFDERQDVLTYGSFAPDDPFLSLSIFRRGSIRPESADFYVAMVRLAGEAGLAVTRNALPSLLPTRFGDFATAEVTLSGAAGARSCLGFRLDDPSAARPVDIAGLACRPAGAALDRASLACVLDRIDLVSAGEDADLRNFFVEAERRRTALCGTDRTRPGGRGLWLDADATPPAMRHLPGSRTR